MTAENAKNAPPPCFDCATGSTQRLDEMFVGLVQADRLALGQSPAERVVFRKLHGVAHGTLEMRSDLPELMKVGVFAYKSLPAWIRFSSDTSPTSTDLGSTLGVGLKLWGVAGPNALGEACDVADFVMQNYPVFFVDNAEEMCAFTYAGVVQHNYDSYLKTHPKTNGILNAMAAQIAGSVLTTQYWAILPFTFGADNLARYTLVPEPPPAGAPSVNVPNDDPNYLAADLAHRLISSPYRFTFMVQTVPRSANPPLDEATKEWPTDQYPYVPVATLVLPQQDIGLLGQADYGQQLAFNIWRTPVSQTPQGSIAGARKVVYNSGANLRHDANGQPLQQPIAPRAAPPPPVADDCIVKAVIYPAIGVARVGNAPQGYVVGPEVTTPPPKPATDVPGQNPYRDVDGRLYPQAARFRIYGCNAKGEIVRELTAPGNQAEIAWTVHLANRKAVWYQFQLALDIPVAGSADPSALRNPTVSDRAALVLDAGAHTIRFGHEPQQREMVAGRFLHQGSPVYLGRMWCEGDARLLVTGGRGHSASADGGVAITFANNDGWHDDVSDGPVTATVVLDGVNLPVTPAWLVVAPPN